jgi:hypothetical protein
LFQHTSILSRDSQMIIIEVIETIERTNNRAS